ncbi:MAG TPA: TonB-dependent receptor [Longimicrobium sp.]|nr:TonB-dependent receptor [Longimicrobium sp.]
MLAPLAALLLSAVAPDTVWGTIRGTVESDPGGLPLASAVVEVSSGGVALTDSTGSYRLARVAAGPQTVRVHSIDHEPFEVEVLVPARGEIEVDVSLRHRPLVLEPVNGVGTGQGGTASDAAPRGVAAITDLPALEGPGTGMDGAGGGAGSGGDVLLVRGSAADLKLVLLDGAPVYAPFHMGGLIESFDPGLLSGARLYLGGAPARYDGGVNYVLDLATRAANHDHWSGDLGADMVAVRGGVDGPLWRGAGILLAGRAVHGTSLGPLEGKPFPYRYADGLLRMDVALGRRVSLAVTGFTNGEGVRVDTARARDEFLRWSNGAGSVRLRFPVAGGSAEVTAAGSEFDAWLPNPADGWQVQARLKRARLAVDVVREAGKLRLGYGYQYDRQWAHHRGLDRTVGERLWFVRDTVGSVGGWYLDGLYRPDGPWVVRGGLRGDMYRGGPFLALSPRLALTWLLGGHATLTLAGGRYHQLVLTRTQKTFDYGAVDVADSLGIATVPRVASANHLALALDQEMPGGVRLGLEGYYKAFRDIPAADRTGAYASGMEVWVRRGEGAVRGWMGYSLGWYWSRADSVGGATRFDGRQTLTAGVQAHGRPGALEVRVAYGSGLQYSALGNLADPSGAGDVTPGTVESSTPSLSGVAPQDFLRLDARLSRTFTPRVGDRETELTPFIRVLNALDRRDALFYRYRPGDKAAKPVGTLPVLPVLGLEWRF